MQANNKYVQKTIDNSLESHNLKSVLPMKN